MFACLATSQDTSEKCVFELLAHTDRAARLYNRSFAARTDGSPFDGEWTPIEVAKYDGNLLFKGKPVTGRADCLRRILERQLAVRAEDSDDDDDPDRTYAFPPPVDLDAYAEACRLPPAEETEDEREARFQRERNYGL